MSTTSRDRFEADGGFRLVTAQDMLTSLITLRDSNYQMSDRGRAALDAKIEYFQKMVDEMSQAALESGYDDMEVEASDFKRDEEAFVLVSPADSRQCGDTTCTDIETCTHSSNIAYDTNAGSDAAASGIASPARVSPYCESDIALPAHQSGLHPEAAWRQIRERRELDAEV